MRKTFWTKDKLKILEDYYNKFGLGAEKHLKEDYFKDFKEQKIRDKITELIRKGRIEKHKNDIYKYKNSLNDSKKDFILKNVERLGYDRVAEEIGLSRATVYRFYSSYRKINPVKKVKTKDVLYEKFKEKLQTMLYMPKDLKNLQKYEVEFLLEEIGITENVFEKYKKKYIKEFGKNVGKDKLRFYSNH